MKRDALDDYNGVFFRPDRKANEQRLEELHWPAFVAVWARIGRDFAWDYFFWQAGLESLRGMDHGPVTPERRETTRQSLKNLFPNDFDWNIMFTKFARKDQEP